MNLLKQENAIVEAAQVLLRIFRLEMALHPSRSPAYRKLDRLRASVEQILAELRPSVPRIRFGRSA